MKKLPSCQESEKSQLEEEKHSSATKLNQMLKLSANNFKAAVIIKLQWLISQSNKTNGKIESPKCRKFKNKQMEIIDIKMPY